MDIDSEIKRNKITYKRIIALLFYLEYSPYYRKIFYKRIGLYSNLLSWYSPGEKTFFPLCKYWRWCLSVAFIRNNFECEEHRR